MKYDWFSIPSRQVQIENVTLSRLSELESSLANFFSFAIFSHSIGYLCACASGPICLVLLVRPDVRVLSSQVFFHVVLFVFALKQFRVHCRIHSAICYSLVSRALAKWIDLQTRENKLHLRKECMKSKCENEQMKYRHRLQSNSSGETVRTLFLSFESNEWISD